MLNINSMSFTGRLTRDAEMKYSQSGMAICKLSVAINDPRKVNGEWKTETTFLDVTCFDKTAERAAEISKGDPVYVEGKIKQENWETKDGDKRSKLGCVALVVKPFKDASERDSGRSSDTPRASDGLNFDNSKAGDDDIDF